MANFETFRAAFAKAKVSRIARQKEQISTKDPVPFLNRAYYKDRKRPEEKSSMPSPLVSIVKLQDKSGKVSSRWCSANLSCTAHSLCMCHGSETPIILTRPSSPFLPSLYLAVVPFEGELLAPWRCDLSIIITLTLSSWCSFHIHVHFNLVASINSILFNSIQLKFNLIQLFSQDLYEALGGSVPDPPDGVTNWRWCSALVMAFMRRHPEHIDELRETYKKGLEWTEPIIIGQAREALPPLKPYFELDESLVKQGKWKESVAKSFDLGGYQNFIPSSLRNKREAAEKEIQEAVERERKAQLEEEEVKRLKSVGAEVNDKRIRAMFIREQRDKLEQDKKRELRFDRNEEKRQSLLKIEYIRLAKAKNFPELKKRWESTCSMNDEMSRLKIVKKDEKKRKPWDCRIPMVDKSLSKRFSLGAANIRDGNPRSLAGPSPLAVAAKEKAMARMAEKQKRNKKPLTELERAIRVSSMAPLS